MANFTRSIVSLDDSQIASRGTLGNNGATLILPNSRSLGTLMPQQLVQEDVEVDGTIDLFRQLSPVRSPSSPIIPLPASPSKIAPAFTIPKHGTCGYNKPKTNLYSHKVQMDEREDRVDEQREKFSNYNDLVDTGSVEQELYKAGFYPEDKIITTDEDGERHVRYIKTATKMGQTVLVELDTKGYVVVDPKDHSVLESKTVNVVPYSLKVGTQQCMGNDVSGVAFICKEGICTIVRNDTGQPEEKNYTFIEKVADKAVLVDGSPIAYPIVKLSEIRANCALVLKSIDDSTRRIRNASYKAVSEDLAKTEQAIKSLDKNFETFKKLRDQAASQLATTIRQLEGFNQCFIRTPPICEAEKAKYRRVIDNLRIRHEKVVELLKISEKVAAKKDEIAALCKEIGSAARYLQTDFKDLDRDFSDEI
jgi:prefoldin subunit 5